MGVKSKIVVWLSALAGVAALLFYVIDNNADTILSGIADRVIRKHFNDSSSVRLNYSGIDINLASRKVEVKDVRFGYPQKGISCSVKSIEAGPVKLWRIWKDKQANLDYLTINNPEITVNLQPADTLAVSNAKAGMVNYLKNVGVKKVSVNDGCVSLRRKDDKLNLSARDIDLSVFDISYCLEDRKLTYCDSLYEISASGFAYVSADSLYRLDVDSLGTRNSEGVVIKGLHGRNTVHKTRLAAAKGKVPVTWSDFSARKLHTSPVNIVRTVLQKSILIDSVFIEGDKLTSHRDARYLPKKTFPMPQESILKIPIPVHIGTIDIRLTYYNMEIKRPEGSAGLLSLHDMGLKVSNFSNEPDHTVVFHITPRMGKGGHGSATLHMKNDSNSSFTFSGSVKNVNISDFGSLLTPLFGASASGNIQSLQTSFSGNRFSTKGDFCLLYDNLKLEVDPEKTPIAFLAKHGKAVGLLEGGLIHRQNPRKLKKEPFKCTVEATRDPMKNYGAYIVSTLLNGVEQTVLNSLAYKEAQKMKNRKKNKKENVVQRIKQKLEKRNNR
ncbi:MAG: hypothetical protein IKX26_01685 [Bacteroidales bacterium]|nr:hypothetical protein [Bacteroidales bacterium]